MPTLVNYGGEFSLNHFFFLYQLSVYWFSLWILYWELNNFPTDFAKMYFLS